MLFFLSGIESVSEDLAAVFNHKSQFLLESTIDQFPEVIVDLVAWFIYDFVDGFEGGFEG